MTCIIVSGRPNSELTSQCMLLSDELCKYYPNVVVVKVLKHPEEWNYYAEEICKLFGFQKESHPLIYFTNGDYIGDRDAYFSYVKKEFNIEIDQQLCYNIVYNLTQENIKKVKDEYLRRTRGAVLREKVDEKVKELEFEDTYNTIDYDYSSECINSCYYYYKYDKKYTPNNYVVFLEPTENYSFEVDLLTEKIVGKGEQNSQERLSFINASKEHHGSLAKINMSLNSLNNSKDNKDNKEINKSKKNVNDSKKEDKKIQNQHDSNLDNDEEVEEEEEKEKRKTYNYISYKTFDINNSIINSRYLVESDVSKHFIKAWIWLPNLFCSLQFFLF